MNYTVYVHVVPNGKFYVGITKTDPEKRWKNGSGYKKQIFYRAIQKYGWDNIEHRIVAENLCRSAAEEMEKRLIGELKSNQKEFGYNLEGGGLKNVSITEETRRKMSESASKRQSNFKGCHHSQETKDKISKNRSGIPAWNKGKKDIFTEEVKKKMSEHARRYWLGKKMPYETRKKIGNANRGKTRTKEQKEYLSKIMNGRKSSEEAIRNRARGRMKPVLCEELGTVFPSAQEAYFQTHIDNSSITAVCRGRRKTAGGYHWRYFIEGEER